jgi:putative nucleotidyltransferase with HDIG domain
MNSVIHGGSNVASVGFVLSTHIDTPVSAGGREAATFDERSVDVAEIVRFATLVFDIDLADADTIKRARHLLAGLPRQPRLVFAVDRGPRRHQQTVQANALGAEFVLPRPVGLAAVLALGQAPVAVPRSHSPAGPSPTGNPSVDAGARMLGASFAALAAGAPLDVNEAVDASRQLLSGVGQEGLHSWLEVVRSHHSGTFQHCLLVTGAAAAYANHTQMPEQMRVDFTMAALLHDIGKAEIPNSILDKPAALTPEEFATIRKHPGIGADYLKRQTSVPPRVVEAVLQHHEYLDGSGYPNGIRGDSVSPMARILTVCDVYGALVEHRSYKPAKPPAEALYVLISMAQQGKLDFRIVRRFADAIGTVLPQGDAAKRVAG